MLSSVQRKAGHRIKTGVTPKVMWGLEQIAATSIRVAPAKAVAWLPCARKTARPRVEHGATRNFCGRL